MTSPSILMSTPLRSGATEYLLERLEQDALAAHLSSVIRNSGDFTLVTRDAAPGDVDFYTDWTKKSCNPWFYESIVSYLNERNNRCVLIRDIVTSPSDSMLQSPCFPDHFFYGPNLFLPITASELTVDEVAEIAAYSASLQTTAYFSSMPRDPHANSSTRFLDVSVIEHVSASIDRIVVDVYDHTGFLVWSLRQQMGVNAIKC